MGTNRFKTFLSLMKLLDICSMFSWVVHQQTYSLKTAFIFTDRLSCQNSLRIQVKSKCKSLQERIRMQPRCCFAMITTQKYARYEFMEKFLLKKKINEK